MLFPDAGVEAEKAYREMKERDERDREVVRKKTVERFLAGGINPITGLDLKRSPYNIIGHSLFVNNWSGQD